MDVRRRTGDGSAYVECAIDAADGLGVPTNFNPKVLDSSGADSYLRKRAVYARSLPDPRPGRRYFVRSLGASIKAEASVNGVPVGRHVGAFTAFAFEITPALKPTGNRLEIAVDSRFDPDVQPIHADFSTFGGLYRDVVLIETDPVCIDPVTDGAQGVRIDADAATGRVTAYVSVLGGTNEVQTFDFPDRELWSPEHPKLYELDIRIRQNGSTDSLRQAFGFRTAEFRADGFYLNGRKRKLRGVNYHQECEAIGWALTEKDIARDIALMKDMGADTVRTAHYPHSAACYDLCDEKGLLAWIEIPASGRVETNAAYVARLSQVAREMVAQHRNHPSLLVWALFNELYGTYDGRPRMPKGTAEPVIAGLQKLVKGLDGHHPTCCAAVFEDRQELNAIPDVFAFNTYPGWYGSSPTNMTPNIEKFLREGGSGKTILGIGEYGSGASVHHHQNPLKDGKRQDANFHPEETQVMMHRIEYAQILAHPRIWGSYIWAMFDFASDNRTEGDHKGINDKGLVTHDHLTTKDAYHFYRANWNPAPQLYLCSKRMVEVDAEKVTVTGFSNVGDVALYVNGREVGRRSPDAVRAVVWEGVKMDEGFNTVELRAGSLTDACTWRWAGARRDSATDGK